MYDSYNSYNSFKTYQTLLISNLKSPSPHNTLKVNSSLSLQDWHFSYEIFKYYAGSLC